MLLKYTKDYLKLKHESRQNERKQAEQLEAMKQECAATADQMEQLRHAAAHEVQAAASTAKTSSDKYVQLYRQQVLDASDADERGRA